MNTKITFEDVRNRAKFFTDVVKIDCDIKLTREEFSRLSLGILAHSMDDKWVMFCDDQSVNYFRSWTGHQIFKGHYRFEGDFVVIYSLKINNDKSIYGERNISAALRLFEDMVDYHCREIDIKFLGKS